MLLKLHWTPFCNKRPLWELLQNTRIKQNHSIHSVSSLVNKDRLNDGNTTTLSEDSDNDVGISKREMDL